jgi:hypothetical protein
MKAALAICITLLLFTPTLAWWENGHMLVAQIAKLDLLENHPEIYPYAEEIALMLGPFTFSLSDTFIEAAVWPDDVKNIGWNFWDAWHFIDRPYDPEGEFMPNPTMTTATDSPFAINQSLTVLMNNTGLVNATMEKSMMMRMLMHVVGDMHQPLHNAEYFSAAFPTGDLGGNLINITLADGEATELHFFWDSIAEEMGTYNRPLNATSVQFFEEYGKGLMTEFPRSAFVVELNISSPANWSYAIYQQAVDYAYDLLPADHVITEEYQSVAYNVCRNNLALAGYRLSDMIVLALAGQVPNTTKSTESEKQYEAAPTFGFINLIA